MTNAQSTNQAHNVNNNVSEKYDTSLDINRYVQHTVQKVFAHEL